MQRFNRLALFAGILAAFAFHSPREASAHADWLQTHGTACTPNGVFNATTWGDFAYYDGSLRNISTVTTRYAVCPITHGFYNFDNSNLRVHVYDGSTTEASACYAFARNSMNSSYITGYQYSSAAQGGPSYVPSYTGFSTIMWVLPFGGAYEYNAISITCSIPKRGTLYSDLIGVGVFTSEPA